MSLENLRIASPCHVSWNEMQGTETRRFCSQCKLNVYNISGMSREEAEGLVAGTEGRLCVRFFRRADGTVLTKDCPKGLKALQKRAALVWSGIAAVLLGIAGCRHEELVGAPAVTNPPHRVIQGEAVPIQGKVVRDPGVTMGIVAAPDVPKKSR